jgi:hypothetical protein
MGTHPASHSLAYRFTELNFLPFLSWRGLFCELARMCLENGYFIPVGGI